MDELKNLKENLLLYLEDIKEETPIVYASSQELEFFKEKKQNKETLPAPSSPPKKPALMPPASITTTPLPPPVTPPNPVENKQPPPTPLHAFEKESPLQQSPLKGLLDQDLYTQIAKLVPGFKLREEVLDDHTAKERKNLWQESLKSLEIGILGFQEQGDSALFLQNLATAIDSLYFPCRVVDGMRFEKEKKWHLFFNEAPLKLVIVPEFRSWRKSMLATHFQELPSQAFLTETKKIPALILHPLFEYLQKPTLKKELWKRLSTQLSS